VSDESVTPVTVRRYRESLSKLSLLIFQVVHYVGAVRGEALLQRIELAIARELRAFLSESEVLGRGEEKVLKRLFHMW
jgi:hypothetical protein